MRRGHRTVIAGLVVAGLLAGAGPAAGALRQPAITIPGPLDGPLPRFTGAPVAAQALDGPFPPANPALAPDGRSGSGLAAGNGAASPLPGPLGAGTSSASALQFGTCASLAFDARERLLAVCNGLLGPSLRVVDPASLDTVASLVLPPRRSPDRADLAGGTHFVVRADGTLLVPANDATVLTVAVDAAALRVVRRVSLSDVLAPDERPLAIAAGFDGNDWVAGNAGTVVALPHGGGSPRAVALGERVSEDIATDPSGVYVATDRAVYRLAPDPSGAPQVAWRRPVAVPATPPAIVPGGHVAVAGGGSSPTVSVLRGGDGGLACAVPVFAPGAGRVSAHLVVAGHALVVTNAHGYDNPLTTEGGGTATGGVARIDVAADGCRVAWTAGLVSPSAQPVVSRATGLLYTTEKPTGFPDAWNLAALDWRTGAVRFTALGGEGLGHNSEGGPVVLGPDGAAYAGTFGGVVRWRDGG